MLVLSLAIIPILVIPLVADLSRATETTLFAIDWFLWTAFALEYGIRLYLAPAKGTHVPLSRERRAQVDDARPPYRTNRDAAATQTT